MSDSTPDTQTENTEPKNDGKPSQDGGKGGDDSAADGYITDDMLPEDLQPTDDNPLAKPLDEDAEEGMSLSPDGPQA